MKLPRFGVEEGLMSMKRMPPTTLLVSIAALSLEGLFQLTQQDLNAFFQELGQKKWTMAG